MHSLGATADDVVGKYIVAAAHGEPNPVLIVLDSVPAHFRPKGLEQSHAGVSIVVHVVVCGDDTFSLWNIASAEANNLIVWGYTS